MKRVHIRVETDESLNMAVTSLRQGLKPGDIILTGPIPKNFKSRFLNIIARITIHVLRGITHSCIYLGNDQIMDIDHKIIRSGNELECVSIEEFIKRKIEHFGGVMIYVARPKKYNSIHRQKVVKESLETFLKNNDKITHTYVGSLKLGMRYIFFRNRYYKEDMSFKNAWTCSEMVAYILKKAGIKIGKRATYMFAPPTFVSSPYFKVKKKLVME